MEMRAIDFLRPDFSKVLAPSSNRLEYWQDVSLEARAAGLKPDWLIVAGIESDHQRQLAATAGFGFAQGSALRPPYDPPTTAGAGKSPVLPITLPPKDIDLSFD